GGAEGEQVRTLAALDVDDAKALAGLDPHPRAFPSRHRHPLAHPRLLRARRPRLPPPIPYFTGGVYSRGADSPRGGSILPEESMKTVGFIGLGNMGAAMASNIRKAGYALVVHDVRIEATRRLVEAGARVATSPAEVARQA